MRIYELLNPEAALDTGMSNMGTSSTGNMSPGNSPGGTPTVGPTSNSASASQQPMQMADAGSPMGPDSTFNKMMGNNQKADDIANSPFGSNSELGLGGNFFQSTVGKPTIPLQ